jgi:hypothetical protein
LSPFGFRLFCDSTEKGRSFQQLTCASPHLTQNPFLSSDRRIILPLSHRRRIRNEEDGDKNTQYRPPRKRKHAGSAKEQAAFRLARGDGIPPPPSILNQRIAAAPGQRGLVRGQQGPGKHLGPGGRKPRAPDLDAGPDPRHARGSSGIANVPVTIPFSLAWRRVVKPGTDSRKWLLVASLCASLAWPPA